MEISRPQLESQDCPSWHLPSLSSASHSSSSHSSGTNGASPTNGCRRARGRATLFQQSTEWPNNQCVQDCGVKIRTPPATCGRCFQVKAAHGGTSETMSCPPKEKGPSLRLLGLHTPAIPSPVALSQAFRIPSSTSLVGPVSFVVVQSFCALQEEDPAFGCNRFRFECDAAWKCPWFLPELMQLTTRSPYREEQPREPSVQS